MVARPPHKLAHDADLQVNNAVGAEAVHQGAGLGIELDQTIAGGHVNDALVARAIDALPERERLAILLRDVEGFSTEEVAEILGNAQPTVRVQIRNARAKLRRWIEAWRRR